MPVKINSFDCAPPPLPSGSAGTEWTENAVGYSMTLTQRRTCSPMTSSPVSRSSPPAPIAFWVTALIRRRTTWNIMKKRFSCFQPNDDCAPLYSLSRVHGFLHRFLFKIRHCTLTFEPIFFKCYPIFVF